MGRCSKVSGCRVGEFNDRKQGDLHGHQQHQQQQQRALAAPRESSQHHHRHRSGSVPTDSSAISSFANLMSELQAASAERSHEVQGGHGRYRQHPEDRCPKRDGSQASALNNLAAKFDQAAQTGQMPNLQPQGQQGAGDITIISPCAKATSRGCGRHALGCLRQLFTAGAIQSGQVIQKRAANGWREPEPVANARATCRSHQPWGLPPAGARW